MLSEKKARFALEYIKDLSAAAAAERAGYSPKSAYSTGPRLLKDPEVLEEISRLKEERVERTETDADYLLGKLRIIADASIQDYVTWKDGELTFKNSDELSKEQLAAIESIEKNKFGIKLKLRGISWTLEMIAKHIGFYEKDNRQKNPEGDVDLSKLSHEAMGELFNAIRNPDK